MTTLSSDFLPSCHCSIAIVSEYATALHSLACNFWQVPPPFLQGITRANEKGKKKRN
jgi:hypothetical protein